MNLFEALICFFFFFFSSRRRHTRFDCDWSSDVCSSDLNFITAVRSCKQTDLKADILEGHLSSALCHTGNVSYRLGQQTNPDEIRERIKGEKEALETFERMAEHLAANGVDLTKTKATLGVALKMDPRTEQFLGNAEANKLLTRDYRKPFVVPEKV